MEAYGRSRYAASGELKSRELLGVEKASANRSAMAGRIAQQLHEQGIGAADAVKIAAGKATDAEIQAGAMPRWGNITEALG